jgi:hypothetical protein
MCKGVKDGKEYDNDTMLCKFGCTEDIAKRTSQHETKYKKDYGNDIRMELLAYTIIDPKYLYDAEGSIRSFFTAERLDSKSELILLNKKNLDKVKQYYNAMHNLYIGDYKQIEEKVKIL